MAKLNPPPVKTQQQEIKPATPKVCKTVEAAKSKKPTEQTPPDSIKPLQLKIPENKKNEFKAYAAMHGRSMNALFLDMFEEYKNIHG